MTRESGIQHGLSARRAPTRMAKESRAAMLSYPLTPQSSPTLYITGSSARVSHEYRDPS